jgi:diacylglycerol diphosphate phosphatase / phosphatidate phosphatase
MHVFRPRVDLGRTLLALAPLLGAALIAISRCEDYRHDVYDVTIGSVLGLLVANFVYRTYYPPLRSSHCDMPFPSRMEMASGYGKLRDEENPRSPRAREREIGSEEGRDDERFA